MSIIAPHSRAFRAFEIANEETLACIAERTKSAATIKLIKLYSEIAFVSGMSHAQAQQLTSLARNIAAVKADPP